MITLYSTSGCHLCEMALALFKELKILDKIDVIDIAFNDALFSRYGVMIPVAHIDGEELFWPFNLQELKEWLNKNGVTYHS